jgi:hypothetical protein
MQSLAWFLLGTVLLLSPKAAKKALEEGLKAQKNGQHEEALQHFETALREGAGTDAKLGLARARSALGQVRAARELYKELLSDKKLPKSLVPVVTSEEKKNAARIARLSLSVPPGATIRINDRPSSGEEELDPGSVTVVVTAEGKVPWKNQLVLRDGEHRSLTVELEAEPRPEPTPAPTVPSAPPLRPWAYGAFVLGGVSLGVGGYLAWTSLQTRETLRTACPGDVCPESQRDEVERGRRQANWATLGLSVGLLATGVGVTLLVVSKDPTDPKTAKLLLRPGNIALTGAFP